MADDSEQEPIKLPSKLADLKVTIPIGLIGIIAVMAWKADEITVDYLSQWFVTKAEAQTLSGKFSELEKKVDDLSERIDSSRVQAVEQEIFRLVIERCMAAGQLRTLLTTQISALVSEWRNLTGRFGQVPATLVECGDVG